MKKYYLLCASVLFMGLTMNCGEKTSLPAEGSTVSATKAAPGNDGLISVKEGKKVYKVANQSDTSKIYKKDVVKANCFFVVSKKDYRLYVYEKVGKDTVLVAHFPVCYAKYPEGKTKTGDMRTPDCTIKHPFRISQIADASSWRHDFKDGRGNIPAYGAWFMRLDLSKSDCNANIRSNRSIGIHGSTSNRTSVPGRDSEGCIRLRDEDIKSLKSNFAQVGTPVVVRAYTQGKYPFEVKAEKACKGYKAPGKRNAKDTAEVTVEEEVEVVEAPELQTWEGEVSKEQVGRTSPCGDVPAPKAKEKPAKKPVPKPAKKTR